jgi:hypothetical protein
VTKERKQFEQIFRIVASDANAWLAQAKGMKLAAEPVLQDFLEIIDEPQSRPGIQLRKLAYIDAYMLLTRFAFENLLKAIAVDRGLMTLNNTNLRGLSRQMDGHSLTKLACRLNLQLTSEERNYLERLEEFTYWAGRYPVSRRLGDYADSHSACRLSFVTTDPEMSDRLFDRLSKLTNNPA